MAYVIRFSPRAEAHFSALTRPQQVAVAEAVARQLRHEPAVETRNRKRMKPERPGYIAPWELRVADLRVYHDVEAVPAPTVIILAVGLKTRNRVRVGDQEYEP